MLTYSLGTFVEISVLSSDFGYLILLVYNIFKRLDDVIIIAGRLILVINSYDYWFADDCLLCPRDSIVGKAMNTSPH